jgi:hypothetical protein
MSLMVPQCGRTLKDHACHVPFSGMSDPTPEMYKIRMKSRLYVLHYVNLKRGYF